MCVITIVIIILDGHHCNTFILFDVAWNFSDNKSRDNLIKKQGTIEKHTKSITINL